jgi:hypothetical protein
MVSGNNTTGSTATAACGNYNLCAGLAVGIEGAVHTIREVWGVPLTAAMQLAQAPHTQPG